MKYIIPLIILSFCLVQIKSDKAEEVIRFAKSKLGCGYVWGASGGVLTSSRLQSYHRAHPDHVDVNICKKWIGKEVFDCAGLVHAAFASVGISLAKGATSIWGQKSLFEQTGRINTLPRDKVCILFREEKDRPGRMAHTGIYIKNGQFIHSSGSKTGVVPGTMNGSWTHWALPKGVNDGSYTPVTPVNPPSSGGYPCQGKVGNASGTVNLRKGPSKSYGVIVRVPVGETITLNGYENGWYKVSYGGKSGYMMAEFINKL